MNKYEFIRYTADRFGIDDNTIETMVDIFASSLHELVIAGQSVTIDEIGEFKTTPIFHNTTCPSGNAALAKIMQQNTVSFKPSLQLTTNAF
jgi:nucleoid DNA-binding protein